MQFRVFSVALRTDVNPAEFRITNAFPTTLPLNCIYNSYVTDVYASHAYETVAAYVTNNVVSGFSVIIIIRKKFHVKHFC